MERHEEMLTEISVLIYSSLSGDITPEEQSKLDRWKELSVQNRELFDRICSEATMREKVSLYNNSNVHAAFDVFVRRREQRVSRIRWIWKVSRYAAVILFPLLVLFLYFNWNEAGEAVPVVAERFPVTQRNMPVLTLSSGQQMVLGEVMQLREENGVLIRVSSDGGMVYTSADSGLAEQVYNTLTTPSQCDFTFTLADGTKVWLNAKSSLRYPVEFTEKERVVYAEGEIYLEVAKDREHPFFVVLNGLKVEVVGTSFNINSYADEEYTEVTLVEGHVVTRIGDDNYSLYPNGQLCWDKKNHVVDIKTVNVSDYIAWKNGQYIFKGRTLTEVAKVLQRWYDVEIIFENENCGETIYTGVINKEERMEDFVYRLNETSLFDCRIEDKKIFIK